jgi:hypothetical protein
LVPVITHSGPSLTALVIIPAGSEPASGSDSANAGDHSPVAHLGRKRSFSSSEPNSWIGSVPSSCTIRISAHEASTFAISSTAMFNISVPVPVPPYSVPNGSPSTSCSASSLRTSHGYSAFSSISADRGAIRSRAIWPIVSQKSTCSCGIV